MKSVANELNEKLFWSEYIVSAKSRRKTFSQRRLQHFWRLNTLGPSPWGCCVRSLKSIAEMTTISIILCFISRCAPPSAKLYALYAYRSQFNHVDGKR
jgi:hypothetical protein